MRPDSHGINNRANGFQVCRCVALLLLLPLASASATEATPDTAFGFAQDAVIHQNYAEAETLLAEWLVSHPHDVTARFLRARVLAWNGNHSKSLDEFDILLQADPASVDYVLGKARTLLWSGHWEEAAALLEFSRILHAKNETIWQLELQALRSGKNSLAEQRARDFLLQARGQFPDATWLMEEAGRAEITRSRYLQIGAGLSREHLSNGLAEWSSAVVHFDYHFDTRRVIYGYVRQVGRFSLTDNELSIGSSVPVGDNWMAIASVSISPAASVLPKHAAAARLEYALGGGWGIGGGLRRATYVSTYSDMVSLSVERYLRAYRVAYRISIAKVEDAPRTVTHEIRSDFYYRDRNMVGLSLAHGQESESVGLDRLITTEIAAVSLHGEHWLTENWAVRWRVAHHRQGDLYDRTGVAIALKYRF